MKKQFLIFLTVFTLLCGYTIYKTPLVFPEIPHLEWLAVVLLSIIFVSQTVARLSRSSQPNLGLIGFVNFGYILMGFWGTWLMLTFLAEIFYLSVSALHSINILNTFSINHLFVDQIIFFLSILMTLTGLIQALLGPQLKNVVLEREDIPSELNGFKIAQISDLHIAPSLHQSYIKKVIQKTNALNPDVIVLTGDIIDAHINSVKNKVDLLDELKSQFGTFYITGNHEYYWNAHDILKHIEQTHIDVLLNDYKIVSYNSKKILFSGVSDPVAQGFISHHKTDIHKSIPKNETTDFKVILSHRPGTSVVAEPLGFNLLLAGHTHAGQFFPFSLLIPFAHKYYRGLNKHNNLHVYVNTGTGYWGPANRFGVNSEITLITLSSKN